MLSSEIRQRYINFFKSKGHAVIPSSSLIPENDSTLLFTNSGMFPLVPYLISGTHPAGKRLVNSQKSFRTEDIEEVGDNRHNTFFEMLGNWSLGDYFKKEQLEWWYSFLFDELKLDPKKIYCSVYAGDEKIQKDTESIEILQNIFKKYEIDAEEGPETITKGVLGSGKEIDFSKQRIFAYRDKNWWQRGDAVGELGGPDSETFYDTEKEHDLKFGPHCHVNCDCGRFLEIGNSVFMQYQRIINGWQELANKNVDFGGGLERVTMVIQNKDNIFETDLFADVIAKINELSGKEYKEDNKSFEIIADHLKAATFIMGDDKGVPPSNTDQGYIVRRLIRRAIRFGRVINITNQNWTTEIAKIIIENYSDIYPELNKNKDFILEELSKEETKFQKTLINGLQELKKIGKLPDNEYDKRGNLDYLSGKTLNINGKNLFYIFSTYGFPIEMSLEEINSIHKKRFDSEIITEELKETLLKEFNNEFEKHKELSRTASAGKFKGGLADSSEETTRLHTAAHLLLAGLRKVLGDHILQKGSNITAERLRFDFSHGEKMTDEEKTAVENFVNDAINKKLDVNCEEMSIDKARETRAMGVFDSKYGEMVKVYTISNVSKEICGGPHVKNTSELGHFKIQKEEASSAGIRRIKAVLE